MAILNSQNGLGGNLSYSIFWKSLCTRYYLYLNCLVEITRGTIQLRVFLFCGKCLIINSVFKNQYRTIQIIYFFFSELCQFVYYKYITKDIAQALVQMGFLKSVLYVIQPRKYMSFNTMKHGRDRNTGPNFCLWTLAKDKKFGPKLKICS